MGNQMASSNITDETCVRECSTGSDSEVMPRRSGSELAAAPPSGGDHHLLTVMKTGQCVQECDTAKAELPSGLKREQDDPDAEDYRQLRSDALVVIDAESIKDSVQVCIQAGLYFPFSKRCVRIQNCSLLPDLGGKLKNGAFMFQVGKRDFKEEFELLPRCGQKICNEVDLADPGTERRLGKIYLRFQEAFDSPRYLELFQSELEPDFKIERSAELDCSTGYSISAQVALGSFARFFGWAIDDTFGKRRLQLNPYESFFMADTGAMQLTLSQAPIGVEESRGIIEGVVPGFVPRYAVFSELQRTTRYRVKMYGDQNWLRSGQWNFFDEEQRHHQQCPPKPLLPTGQDENLLEIEEMSKLLDVHDEADGTNTSARDQDQLSNKRVSGFAISIGNVERARKLLALPRMASGLDQGSSHFALPNSGLKSASYGSLSCAPQSDGRNNSLLQENQTAAPNGIDIAFYACEKAMYWTPPAFDVAITKYRDQNVPVSAVFAAFRAKKNPRIPVLMERFDHGQLSGYGLQLARVPTVEYSGRKDEGILEAKDSVLKRLVQNKRKLLETEVAGEEDQDGKRQQIVKEVSVLEWVPSTLRRRQAVVSSGAT